MSLNGVHVCVSVCVRVCKVYVSCVGYLVLASELCTKNSVVNSSCVLVLTVDNGWENPL